MMIEQRYKLPTISLSENNISPNFKEAFLEFYGIDHLRPTYTAWIFFNATLPKKVTPRSRGFAGSFAVFGHAECWGDIGHCHGNDGIGRFDTRPSHPMTPAFKRVPVSHALNRKLNSNAKKLDIWVYAFTREKWINQGDKSLIRCNGLQLVTM